MSIIDSLNKRLLFFDGGYGSLMQQKGLTPGILGETWNLERPEEVISIHADYLRAGCDILKSNTFNTNVLKFPDGDGPSVEDMIHAAFMNAREAMKRVPSDRERFIALDMGPTGKLLEPLGDLSFDEAYEIYARNVRAGVKEGADLVLIETMSDTYEIKAAVLAAKENSDLPVFVTVTFDENGQLLTGSFILDQAACDHESQRWTSARGSWAYFLRYRREYVFFRHGGHGPGWRASRWWLLRHNARLHPPGDGPLPTVIKALV